MIDVQKKWRRNSRRSFDSGATTRAPRSTVDRGIDQSIDTSGCESTFAELRRRRSSPVNSVLPRRKHEHRSVWQQDRHRRCAVRAQSIVVVACQRIERARALQHAAGLRFSNTIAGTIDAAVYSSHVSRTWKSVRNGERM